MTDVLMRFLKSRYHEIQGIQHSDISGYPPPDGCERIYFSLYRKDYLEREQIISPEQIIAVAARTFTDVGWEFHKELGELRNVITFYEKELAKKKKSMKRFRYELQYDAHDIEFGKLDSYLHITVSTGNRGRTVLGSLQRKRYASFIDEIVDETLNTIR